MHGPFEPRRAGIGQRRRSIWIGAALLVLAGSVPGRAEADCLAEETISMIDPVVTVIAGPGDAAAEQGRWSGLDGAWLEGLTIWLGDEAFSVEGAP